MSEPSEDPPADPIPEPDETSAADEELERAELQKYVDELKERIREKSEMREKNINRILPDDSYFFKLDSSLKKNTAYVKKLKQFTAAQLDVLIKDMSSLNLSKYISEVCSALSEAKVCLYYWMFVTQMLMIFSICRLK
jgi:regulator of nonsense transcripts 2